MKSNALSAGVNERPGSTHCHPLLLLGHLQCVPGRHVRWFGPVSAGEYHPQTLQPAEYHRHSSASFLQLLCQHHDLEGKHLPVILRTFVQIQSLKVSEIRPATTT